MNPQGANLYDLCQLGHGSYMDINVLTWLFGSLGPNKSDKKRTTVSFS